MVVYIRRISGRKSGRKLGIIVVYQYLCEVQILMRMKLEDISNGVIPGMTRAKAMYLSECAVSCMERLGHRSGVEMTCGGIVTKADRVAWDIPFDEQLKRSTEDLQEATEHGAECISVLFAIEHTSYTVVRRSRKKTGVDYWLGMKDDELFQDAARLEVSGILNDKKALESRKKQKIRQTDQSDASSLPAYISIVEFGTPAIEFVRK